MTEQEFGNERRTRDVNMSWWGLGTATLGFGDNCLFPFTSFPHFLPGFLPGFSLHHPRPSLPKDCGKPVEPSDPIPAFFPHGLGSPGHAGLCPWRFFPSPSKLQEIPAGWIHPEGRNVLGRVLSAPFPTWIAAPVIPRCSSGSGSRNLGCAAI